MICNDHSARIKSLCVVPEKEKIPAKVVALLSIESAPDHLLLELISFGSGDAFTVVYNRYIGIVRKQIIFFYRQPVEDVAQEIFSSLWIRKEKLAGIGSVPDYLFCMVRNLFINEQKKSAVRKKALHEIGYRGGHSHCNRNLSEVRDTAQQLEKMIDALPPKTKSVLLLSKDHGMKLKEIAGVMRTSKTTVKNQLRDARKRLRESMDIQNDFLNLS